MDDDWRSLSPRRRVLTLFVLLGLIVQGAVIDQMCVGAILLGLTDVLVAFIAPHPAWQLVNAVVGVVGLTSVLGAMRARWHDRRMWLLTPPVGLLELLVASLAFHS